MIEELFRKSFRRLGFTDPCRSEEQETPYRPVLVGEPRFGSLDRLCDGPKGKVLSLHMSLQPFEEVQVFLVL